jgi:Protein of unknown function (DUF3617)
MRRQGIAGARGLFAGKERGELGMKTRVAKGILIAALVIVGAAAGGAAEEIKGGKWQFTTQMQLPASAAARPGAPAGSGSGQGMTRTACVDAANPVPPETQQGNVQCKIDKVERKGGLVTWSMTCSSPQGPIQSSGAARYSGDTMEATLTARLPGPNGQPVDAPGRITGRYVGPCNAS